MPRKKGNKGLSDRDLAKKYGDGDQEAFERGIDGMLKEPKGKYESKRITDKKKSSSKRGKP